jgi:hypothetical protein
MVTGIDTPSTAYSRFLAAWPAIVEECRAVLGSELHYQAMIYHALRTAGGVPRDQLGMNVKCWVEDPVTPLFRDLDERKHPDYRGGFEPIPDVVIFHEEIRGDWRRRNRRKSARCLLLAVEVKASEREAGRLQPGEIIRDIDKLAAFREELRHHGSMVPVTVPVMVVIDTAPEPGERMIPDSLEDVRNRAKEVGVSFFYCGVDACIEPSESLTAVDYTEPLDGGKGVA